MKNKIKRILNDLEKVGWSVQKNFFSKELSRALQETLNSLREKGQLQQAGIGRKKLFHVEQDIRSDDISWFDKAALTPAQEKFLSTAQQLQDTINQQFYLGLFKLEVHFALYSPNAFYKRHLDQHKNQDTRVVTLIYYLNENWHEDNGGQLQLYLKNAEVVSVLPEAGTLVCFMSTEFEHEVLAANCERASLTGWFRKRE